MNKNESTADRAIRIGLGIVLLLLGWYRILPYSLLWLGLGIVAIFTGLTGFCLLYSILGISTCERC